MVNFLLGPRAPSPAMSAKRENLISSSKLARLRRVAGEGARGPSRNGYQRPNLEFQTDPLPRFAGFRYFLVRFLGFRCAPPQALCRRPLRGLAGFVFFAERDLLSAFAGVA